MSNNPFRNRIQSQISPEPSPRPVSTNPFLDAAEIENMAFETHNNNNVVATTNSVDKAANVFVRARSLTKRIARANRE